MRTHGGFKCFVHIRSFAFYVRANATVLFLERSTIRHSAAARLSVLSRRKTFPTTSEAILSPFSPMRTRKTSPSVKMYRPMLSRCQGTSQFVLPEFRDDSPVPESVPRQLQHSSGSDGPCLPQGLKREPDTDTDSSSVEVLCIKRASKKARRASATIKKEPAQGSEVPAPLPVAREKRGPFCAQGHDMTWVALLDNVVLSARKYAYFHVTCNVCEVAVTGSTYRCDACDWDVCLTCAEQA